MKNRIQALDGLRFLAAAGVLWIHTWTLFGNPRFYVGKLDLASIIAIGGNGVELFFVISGFCMYYFYSRRPFSSYRDFGHFFLKRWVRLSPAFYTATVIYLLHEYFFNSGSRMQGLQLIHSLFYLNYWLGEYGVANHFWTLTVEWQFYLLVSLLLVWQRKAGFRRSFLYLFSLLGLAAVTTVFVYKAGSDYLTGTILFRGVEFGAGILTARLLLYPRPAFKNRKIWFFIFVAIICTGRVLVSERALRLAVHYYNLFKLAGFTLMGIGFSGFLYIIITSNGRLARLFGNRLMVSLGRVSYSFYLFHALIFPYVTGYIVRWGIFQGIFGPLVATGCSILILYPLSLLSYTVLEKPFLSVGNMTSK
ncbi:acyltransferase family protein [Mucilaginibacter sp.]|uniref:acyltransferase family protein n=1 Tax=Mucilaginibacter sp. TaxID=1882438 RepID=UPI0035BC4867